MSSIDLPEFVQKLLDRIIEEHEFIDYSIQIKPNSESGMGSEMFNIKIRGNSSDKSLHILCKVAPFDAARREMCLSKIIFKREALFYETIMPNFAKFQEEKCMPEDDQFLSYPKCCATTINDDCEHYAIVMEHLQSQGLKVWNKAKPLPIESLRVTMRELGKFHGLSFAMKDQKPAEFAELKQLKDTFRTFVQSENIQNLFNGAYDRAIKTLRSENHKNIICDIKINFMAYLEYCVNHETSDRFGVLSHGIFTNF